MLHLFAWARRAYTNLRYLHTCSFNVYEIHRVGFAGCVFDELQARHWLLDSYTSTS